MFTWRPTVIHCSSPGTARQKSPCSERKLWMLTLKSYSNNTAGQIQRELEDHCAIQRTTSHYRNKPDLLNRLESIWDLTIVQYKTECTLITLPGHVILKKEACKSKHAIHAPLWEQIPYVGLKARTVFLMAFLIGTRMINRCLHRTPGALITKQHGIPAHCVGDRYY